MNPPNKILVRRGFNALPHTEPTEIDEPLSFLLLPVLLSPRAIPPGLILASSMQRSCLTWKVSESYLEKKETHAKQESPKTDQAVFSSCCAGLSQTLSFTESNLTEHHSFVSLLWRKGKPTAGSPQHFSDVTTANIHQCVLQLLLSSLV